MYAKIFQQIYTSSIANDYRQRFVFMDMLVLADQNGVVDMTHEGIARMTNVPLDIVKEAIGLLESPDPKSRNPSSGGARIARLDEHRDWGWLIVNYAYYRRIASEEQRREKTLNRVHKYRQKATLEKCNAGDTLVNARNAKQKQKDKHKQIDNKKAILTPSEPIQEAMAQWIQAYQRIYGRQYFPKPKKDAIAAAELVKLGFGPEKIGGVAEDVFRNTKGFWCQRAVTLPVFALRINELMAEVSQTGRFVPQDITEQQRKEQDLNGF